TLFSVCFSKSGTSASTTCLNAPAVRTLTSAAEPDVTLDRHNAAARQIRAKICVFMGGTLFDLQVLEPELDARGAFLENFSTEDRCFDQNPPKFEYSPYRRFFSHAFYA